MFRTAIVGCGGIAQTHATNLSQMANVRIVAVCDILPERANALRDKFAPDALVFDNYVTMLDTVKPDVLHVCTPHYLHVEMAIAALERNINVLLEKPVAITLEQASLLKDAEAKSQARICISFQNRYLSRNLMAKHLIGSGVAGKVKYATANVLWHRDVPYYVNSHWRGFMATEGGGVMINQAIHTLDLLLWMVGEPEKLSAMTANHHLKGAIDVEDTANALITFKNGAQAMFFATTAYPYDAPISLKITCEKMDIELKEDKLFINGIPQNTPEAITVKDTNGKDYWGVGHKMLFEDFYKRLQTGEPMPIDVVEATKALRVLLAMYESKGNDITL